MGHRRRSSGFLSNVRGGSTIGASREESGARSRVSVSTATQEREGLCPTLDELRDNNALLKIGHRGQAVRYIQELLNVTVNGHYTGSTIKAVIALQSRERLTVDGQVDGLTLSKIEQRAASPASARANDQPTTLDGIPLEERKKIQILTGVGGRFGYLVETMNDEGSSALPEGFELYFDRSAPSDALKQKFKLAARRLITEGKYDENGGFIAFFPVRTSVTLFLDYHRIEGLSEADHQRATGCPMLCRFTRFHNAAGKDSLLVEELGPFDEAMAFQGLVKAGKEKFSRYKFKFHPQWKTQWEKDKQQNAAAMREKAEQAFYAAISLLPQHVLDMIKGIVVTSSNETEHVESVVTPDGKTETRVKKPGGSASYARENHTLTFYRWALPLESEIRQGTPKDGVHEDFVTKTVVHELGHAVDFRRLVAYRAKAHELSAALKANKNVEAQALSAECEKLLKEARTESGRRYFVREKVIEKKTDKKTEKPAKELVLEDVEGSAFLNAFEQDGGLSITEYGTTSRAELFAECYSLSVTDAERLKALRPAIFAFLNKNFGFQVAAKPKR